MSHDLTEACFKTALDELGVSSEDDLEHLREAVLEDKLVPVDRARLMAACVSHRLLRCSQRKKRKGAGGAPLGKAPPPKRGKGVCPYNAGASWCEAWLWSHDLTEACFKTALDELGVSPEDDLEYLREAVLEDKLVPVDRARLMAACVSHRLQHCSRPEECVVCHARGRCEGGTQLMRWLTDMCSWVRRAQSRA